VRYVSTEEFTNDFINSIRDDKAGALPARYRDVDILLIDDIQFLEARSADAGGVLPHLQHAAQREQADRDQLRPPPKQLATLEDRLRNRFEWGLITDIQPPDLETRIAILQKKAPRSGCTPRRRAGVHRLSKISTNIRELEGALIRVTAFASLNRQPVDLRWPRSCCKDLIPDGAGPEITATRSWRQTAEYFGVTIDDLCGPRAAGCWSTPARSPCTCAAS
jgi:chromosomal replication initiator protein